MRRVGLAVHAVLGMLDLLREPLLRRIWLTETLNSFGSALTFWALAWLLLQRAPDQPWLAGAVLATLSGFTLVGQLWLGGHLDRWDRRRVLIFTNAALAALTAGLPVAAQHPAALLAVVALVGLAGSLHHPAWQATLPALVPRERLPAAQALFNSTWMVSGLAAPAVAGLLIGVIGPERVLYVDAVTYAVAAVAYLTLRFPRQAPAVGRALRDLTAGWRHALTDRALWGRFVALGAVNAFTEPLMALVLPRVATSWAERGMFLSAPVAVGLLDTFIVAFELLGAVWLARRAVRGDAGRKLVLAGCALAVSAGVGVAFAPVYAVAALLACVMGAAFAPVSVLVGVIVADRTPAELLGRVSGVRAFIGGSLRPPVTLGAGALLTALGPLGLAGALGVVSVSAIVLGWGGPRWRPGRDWYHEPTSGTNDTSHTSDQVG